MAWNLGKNIYIKVSLYILNFTVWWVSDLLLKVQNIKTEGIGLVVFSDTFLLRCSVRTYIYLLINYIMDAKKLVEKMKQDRYLQVQCAMTGYEVQNWELFFSIDEDSAKNLFDRLKEEFKADKEVFKKNYKAITEMEMLINWKARYYSEVGEYDKSEKLSRIWEKMHDFNGNHFDYNTEEWKYYFQTID